MFTKPSPTWRSVKILVPAALVLILVVLGVVYWFVTPRPDGKTYQAVFLTNGQVYFGKLAGINGHAPVMNDVFYIQANQALQQGSEAKASASGTPAQGQPQFTLLKLGQAEIHGPEDKIFLMKPQILFWENLRADSEVIKTIKEFKTSKP